ncbi:MAG: helix-turn-helix transcriptional regulator [Ruminococcus sp.]|nr:helix-turn-helix transcriptional regulator [Ruminococcus sp.]
MGFGKLLSEKLEKNGIRQSDLADGIGISRSTLNGIITRDTSKVEIETFLKICKYIKCDPEDFYNEYIEQKKIDAEKDINLSNDEIILVKSYRLLEQPQKELILHDIELLNRSNESYAKGEEVI